MQLHNLISQGIDAEQKVCTKDNKDERSGDTCDQPLSPPGKASLDQ